MIREPLGDPLTWDQVVKRHGHHCAVVWDRDMSEIDWVPKFIEYRATDGLELWADDSSCAERVRLHGSLACRCHYWDPNVSAWLPRVDQTTLSWHVFQRRLLALETARSATNAITLLNEPTPYAGVHEFGTPKKKR